MPMPVSLTQTEMYWPGASFALGRAGVEPLLAVSMMIRRPRAWRRGR
jgi:hypothetical protein